MPSASSSSKKRESPRSRRSVHDNSKSASASQQSSRSDGGSDGGLPRRRAPFRPTAFSWVPSSREQLLHAERVLFGAQSLYRATIEGLHTLASARDITLLDDSVRAAAGGGGGREGSGGGRAGDAKMFRVAEGDVDREDGGGAAARTLEPCGGDGGTATSDGTNSGGGGGPETDDACGGGPPGAWSAAAAAGSDDPSRETIVLIHGYAGGSGNWARNWAFLAERYNVYAVDLPGFAASARPPVHPHDQQDAMDFLCGHLERWLAAMAFSGPVILAGHSFGCLVAGTLAMRLGPGVVRMLVFVEPWGVNRGSRERVAALPLPLRLVLRSFYHVSPLALLRGVGPLGPRVLRAVRPEFGRFWCDYCPPDVVYDYIYHCNALRPATGERLFRACCHLDVSAQRPLVDALPAGLDRRVPVAIALGEDSVIMRDGAVEMERRLAELGFATALHVVPGGTHQVLAQRADLLNTCVHDMITGILAGGRRGGGAEKGATLAHALAATDASSSSCADSEAAAATGKHVLSPPPTAAVGHSAPVPCAS